MILAEWLRVCPVIAILRGIKPEEAEPVCAVLESEEIAIVEVPRTHQMRLRALRSCLAPLVTAC